jgi:hypothetical protein
MKNVHIVVLKDNDLTENNIQIGLKNTVWGMATKGKHEAIRQGDLVMFLIGVSINNPNDIPIIPLKDGKFPNFKNYILEDHTLTNKFAFNINTVILGNVISDFYIEETEIWPPKISKLGKINYYPNRFDWNVTHKANDVILDNLSTTSQFHSDIIKAIRDNGAQPSIIPSKTLSLLSSNFSLFPPLNEEEYYQEQIQSRKLKKVAEGPVKKLEKGTSNGKKQQWKRDPNMAGYAILNSKNNCEVNSEHITFKHFKTGLNFVEAHHLLPMEYQGEFDNSIDVPENIIALCPNCHRAFHHSDKSDKQDLISLFYIKRVDGLKARGIYLTLQEMHKYYEC